MSQIQLALVTASLIALAGRVEAASTITGNVLANPEAAFADFKKTYRKLPRDTGERESEKYFIINTCLRPERAEYRSRSEKLNDALWSMASNEASLSKGLERAGYPRTVWRRPLDELMKEQLNILSRRSGQSIDFGNVKKEMLRHERRFLNVLEAYRKTSSKRLPAYRHIRETASCAGDFFPMVKVQTSPAGGTISLIKDRNYVLCTDSKPSNCDLWFKARPNSEFPPGTYRYKAQWGTNPEECGKVELLRQGPASERAEVKMIKETGRACRSSDQ
jgi:hypothetical protein